MIRPKHTRQINMAQRPSACGSLQLSAFQDWTVKPREKEKQTNVPKSEYTFSFARKNAYIYIFTIWHSILQISYIYIIHVIHINVMRSNQTVSTFSQPSLMVPSHQASCWTPSAPSRWGKSQSPLRHQHENWAPEAWGSRSGNGLLPSRIFSHFASEKNDGWKEDKQAFPFGMV